MAVPKRRVSKARRDKRRSNVWKMNAPELVKCPECGAYKRPHRVCGECGKYKGRQILGRKTVEFMAQNRLTDKQRETMIWDSVKGYGYGCLMRVLMDQGQAGFNGSPGEFGWDGWTGNYVTMDFSEELVFLYFIQLCGAGTTPAVRKLKMVTYSAL